MAFRSVVACVVALGLGVTAARPQTVAGGWAIDDHPDLLSANVCATGGVATEAGCFGVACVAGGTRFDYVVTGLVSGAPSSYRAWIVADGVRLVLLTFTLDDTIGLGGLYLASADDATKARVGQALAVAARVGVVPEPPLPGFARVADLPMTGGVAVLRQFGDMCFRGGSGGAAQAAPPQAASVEGPRELTGDTPDTNPARFRRLEDLSRHDAETEAIARQLLAGKIVEMQAYDTTGVAIEVDGYLVAFADARQVLVATLCHPLVFGITGCESHFFLASGAGQPFREDGQGWIGGGPYWLDMQAFTDGLPNLISVPHTGMGAYYTNPLIGGPLR